MCFSDFSGQRVREGRLNQAMSEKVLKTLITKQSTFAPVGVENHDDDGNSWSVLYHLWRNCISGCFRGFPRRTVGGT